MTLVQVDLSQAELRTMAVLSDDTWMKAALQEDQGDFFDNHMMPVCFPNVDVTQITAVEKKELRTKVKTVQYGLAFGRQAGAIAAALKMPYHEAQAIINNYFANAQQFYQWRKSVMLAATTGLGREKYLTTPFGRKYQSEIVTHKNVKNVEREALAFMPQSTSSDICLTTAIRIHQVLKSLFNSHIVALVHDAIIVECPNEETAHRVGKYIMQEFRVTGISALGEAVPFLSEYSVGRSWGDLA